MSLRAYLTEAKKAKKIRSVTSSKPKAYRPKLGHTVRTLRGPNFAGQVIRRNKSTVDFKTATGKMYRAHIKNVKRSETIDVVGEEVVTELNKDTYLSHAQKAMDSANSWTGFSARTRASGDKELTPHSKAMLQKAKHLRSKAAVSMKKYKEKTAAESVRPTLRNYLLERSENQPDHFEVHYKKFTGYRTTSGFKDSQSAIRHAVEKAKMHRHPAAITKGKNQYGTVDKYGKVTLSDSVIPDSTVVSELSVPTLTSYIKKAKKDRKNWETDASAAVANGVDSTRMMSGAHKRAAAKYIAKAQKRTKGIITATGLKAAQEQTLVELKGSTLRSYIGKSLTSASDHHARAQTLRDRHNDAAGDSSTLNRAKWNTDKYRKRMKGISNAAGQLASGKKPAPKPQASTSVVSTAPVRHTTPAPSAPPVPPHTPAAAPAPTPKAVVKHPPGNGGMSDSEKAATIARINQKHRENLAAQSKSESKPSLSVSSNKPKRVVGALKASLQAAQAKAKPSGNQ